VRRERSSVLEKLGTVDEQCANVLKEAKSAALQKAQGAISELRQLGFHYRLVESSSPPAAKGSQDERSGLDDRVMHGVVAMVEAPSSDLDQTLLGS